MFKIGKNTLFKGTIYGTATSNLEGCSFVIRIKEPIVGMPEEFVVYSSKFRAAYDREEMRGGKKTISTHIRKGDILVVEGEIIQEFIGNDDLEIIRMGAEHVYNVSLKCGF